MDVWLEDLFTKGGKIWNGIPSGTYVGVGRSPPVRPTAKLGHPAENMSAAFVAGLYSYVSVCSCTMAALGMDFAILAGRDAKGRVSRLAAGTFGILQIIIIIMVAVV